MVAEWSDPKGAVKGGFHADFYHWFDGFNDLLQKESWRILNGHSEGHSFFDKEGKGNITNFLSKYLKQYEEIKDKGFACIPIGNHDLSRLNIDRTEDELEMIFAFSITMPGIPFIYYGNEIGMRQLYGLPHVEGGYNPRAGARTPMQWSEQLNAGFSTASSDKLYLPVDSAESFPNVEAQEKEPDSLLNRVKKLIGLKKEIRSLAAHAEFVPLFAKENTYPFIFARSSGDEVVMIAFNPSAECKKASFSSNIDLKDKVLLAGKEIKIEALGDEIIIGMPGQSYSVYKCSKKG
jgi:maltose alpha-D-glucosyltransferase/alpha-amylase